MVEHHRHPEFALLGWALWVSEIWASWADHPASSPRRRLYYKARSVVMFDRVLNGETHLRVFAESRNG